MLSAKKFVCFDYDMKKMGMLEYIGLRQNSFEFIDGGGA